MSHWFAILPFDWAHIFAVAIRLAMPRSSVRHVYFGATLSGYAGCFATGRVTVLHRYWPLRARTLHEFEVSQIKTFGMVRIADCHERLGDSYAFFMMDGSTVELGETGSNALDSRVVDQVNLMLGTL